MSTSISEKHTHTQVELWGPGRQAGRLDKSVFPHPRDTGSLGWGGRRGGYFIFILSV